MTGEFDQGHASVRRAADIAADYEGLQGLVNAGLGVALLYMAASGNVAAGVALMAGLMAAGQGYYLKKYGRAINSPRRTWAIVAVSIPACLLTVGGLALDASGGAPIALGALFAAVALVGVDLITYRHVGVTALHWALIVILGLAALVPTLGWPSTGLWQYSLTLIGTALLIQGASDHLRLTRAMAPAR
ncbi:hypothetical protein [Microlunatus parietis]|uniref:Uncharacterized protein n=1 Tax=Microlunatus parietis TaxID=682979 RepID=A0A7Y9I9J1_9ACTN|nr:hypothetical protein [Microlunatus parietis]NYE72518.1 hypothetical protein [Microlunatus parietis]